MTARTAALVGLALLILAALGDSLYAPGTKVLGIAGGDMGQQFLPWREFGFGELAKGNLALWNPHIFAGAPYFGGMQSALLYPVNWLFMVLPLPLAVNWSIAINLWLLGAFTFLWASRRGLHPFAAFVSGALVVFCAPTFLRVFAGHLTNLSTMAWVPLEFVAVDEWLARRSRTWCLLGMLAVAMQIFGGHPQYVYFAAIAVGIYASTRLVESSRGRLAALTGVVGILAGGALLASVQLLAGMQATEETVRGLPLSAAFAASFSFPPENLLTLLAPDFFGDLMGHTYWGRWYPWEASAFVGVVGLALAAYGMSVAHVAGKRALLVTLAAALILALGDYTPLFALLYRWVPLFDRFRGTGKFMFPAALILVLFAGYGLDRILRERVVARRALLAGGAAVAALLIGATAVLLADWTPVMRAIQATGQTALAAAGYERPALVAASQSFAALGLFIASLTLAAGVLLAFWVRREARAALVLGALAVAEVFVFARLHRPTFDSAQVAVPELRGYLAAHPGDYRILNLEAPNDAMSLRAFDAWGYDPGVTRRYAELIAWTEGEDPKAATQYVTFHRFSPLLTMVRVKYVVVREGGMTQIVPGAALPLGRLELVSTYQVRVHRKGILSAMGEESFDPQKEVILEQQPDPAPVAGQTQGRARIVREGTDFMDIEADLANPAILLITDAWADGWRAVPLEGSGQLHYKLVPADYALRGVALGRGHHHLRIEYAPPLFYFGALLSALAWPAWIGALLLARRKEGDARG
ncbi:MAG TPA: hypothetical protein VEH03_04450 [Burkholderiales bacterium]|nr:hypothetical protein [Burkholderiales bacterium]